MQNTDISIIDRNICLADDEFLTINVSFLNNGSGIAVEGLFLHGNLQRYADYVGSKGGERSMGFAKRVLDKMVLKYRCRKTAVIKFEEE